MAFSPGLQSTEEKQLLCLYKINTIHVEILSPDNLLQKPAQQFKASTTWKNKMSLQKLIGYKGWMNLETR